MTLRIGASYFLAGMRADLWEQPHKEFGRPRELAAKYLGCIDGHRTWHLFEVWVHGQERGVILMSAADLAQLHVTELA